MLVDDQRALAEEIKSVLETDPQLTVVHIAGDGAAAVSMIRMHQPDVVLMDVRMPTMDGVIATQRIKTENPEVQVLILTTFDDSDYILNAINYGASGYLLKDTSAAALIDAVKNAYEGDTVLPAKIARKITDAAKNVAVNKEYKLKKAFSFSEREVEIAMMMYEGFTNRQISSALKISEGTTRNYISTIYIKTNSENRAGAISAIKEVL